MDDGINIVRVLHESMDIVNQLEGISLPTTLIYHLTVRLDRKRKIQGTLHPNPNGFWSRKAIVLSIQEAAKA